MPTNQAKQLFYCSVYFQDLEEKNRGERELLKKTQEMRIWGGVYISPLTEGRVAYGCSQKWGGVLGFLQNNVAVNSPKPRSGGMWAHSLNRLAFSV